MYERVVAVPGIHLRRLARETDLSVGTVEHHLRTLQKFGLVRSVREGARRAHFAADAVDARHLRYLFLLRHRTFRRILLRLLDEPGLGFRELTVGFPVRPSTLSYHLQRLEAAGAVERLSVGRERFYQLREPDALRGVLEQYRHTFRGVVGRQQLPVGQDPRPVAQGPMTFELLLERVPPRPAPAPRSDGPRSDDADVVPAREPSKTVRRTT